MPADEVHHEDSAGELRARSGPRHAAPRKPLLTRLHVPAGKAIAIAAMPTAVLMGMGLTPQLAQAKPLPKNPFQDGPCVTAPDEASKDTEKEADKAAAEKAEKAEAEQAEKDAAKKDGKDDAGKATDEPTPSPSAGDKSGSDADKAEPTPSPSASEDEEKAEEPAPEPSETKNPLDPLGVGDALKDIFTPDEKESASSTPAPSASEETTSPESAQDKAKDTVDDVTKPVDDTVDGLKDGVEDGAGKAKDEADKAKEKAEKAAEEAADKAEAEAKEKAEDPMAADEDGKKPFPCVVEKKVDGDAEKTPSPIPNQPWNLEASSLTLKGADYQGVVNLTMPNGKTKQSLKYVIENTDIGDLHQIVDGPSGKKYHVEAEKGSTSTIRGGKTTMYTESISGKLFGLIPITFDPEHPPPLNIPLIYFTDVKVKQAGQFGGNLHIPGLHQSITD